MSTVISVQTWGGTVSLWANKKLQVEHRWSDRVMIPRSVCSLCSLWFTLVHSGSLWFTLVQTIDLVLASRARSI